VSCQAFIKNNVPVFSAASQSRKLLIFSVGYWETGSVRNNLISEPMWRLLR